MYTHYLLKNYGPLAQLVEQFPFKEWVVGSSPTRLTIKLKFFHKKGEFIKKIINKIFQPLNLYLMVSRDGLEPSTHSLKGNCSTN